MTAQLIHRVTYYEPGSFFPETVTMTLDERSTDAALANAPKLAFCFELFDLPPTPNLGPEFTVLPKPMNKSKRYYIGGSLYDIDAVEAMQDMEILASNMRANRWSTVIKCRTGNWQLFESGDVLLPDPQHFQAVRETGRCFRAVRVCRLAPHPGGTMSDELLDRILTALAGVFVGLGMWCFAIDSTFGVVACIANAGFVWAAGTPS